jgi:hypothetical protein
MNLTHGNMITNKVKMDHNVFGAMMLDDTNIVTEHNRSRRRWSMKLVEELANPTSLSNSVSYNSVLSLSAGMRDHVLTL